MTKEKKRALIWLQFGVICIIGIVLRLWYGFGYSHGDNPLLERFLDKFSFEEYYAFTIVILLIFSCFLVYKFRDDFIKKRSNSKYPKIFESGIVGEEFALLGDDEKVRTVARTKRLAIFGVIFLIICGFLLFTLL